MSASFIFLERVGMKERRERDLRHTQMPPSAIVMLTLLREDCRTLNLKEKFELDLNITVH